MSADTPTLVTLALAKLTIAAIFAALDRRRRHRALPWWTAAFALDGLRHLITLAVPGALGFSACSIALVAGSYCLLVGTLTFVDRPTGRAWLAITIVVAGALATLPLAGVDGNALWPLAGGYLALTRGRSGLAIARASADLRLRVPASLGLFLLAVIPLIQPWALARPSDAPWSVVIGTTLLVIVGFMLVLLDFDRLHSEVESQQRQLSSVFEGSGQNIAVYDKDGEILRMNPSFAALVGSSSPLRIDAQLVPDANHLSAFFQASDFTSRPVQRVQLQTRAMGLRDFDISVSRLPDEDLYMVFAFDVSKIVKLQKDLDRARRLEALGRMATGISHDINNVLFVINTYIGLGRAKPDPTEAFAGIKEATLRAQRLTQKLSIVGQRRRVQLQRLRVDRLIRDMEEWLSGLMNDGSELVIDVPEDARFLVEADVVEVEQLLFNLVSNARAATPDGEKVEVVAQHVEREDTEALVLEVRDRGPGIPEDLRERVFEPFFSTRTEGAGLGLTAVKSIVEDRGWRLQIRDRADGGTAFRVEMPVLPTTDDEEAARPSALEPLRILLVDDYPPLVKLVARALRKDGHEAVAIGDPSQALEELSRRKFDVLVTDMDMPSLQGSELMEQAWKLDPNLDVVLVSGQEMPDVPDNPKLRFLAKPFSDRALRACLQSFDRRRRRG